MNIQNMNVEELRAYAAKYRIELTAGMRRDEIIRAIRAGRSSEAPAEDEHDDREDGFIDIAKRPDLRKPTHIINIQADPNDPMAPDVFVGVNGFGWSIKRGIDVAVPQIVVDALASAVQPTLSNTGKRDPDGKIIYIKRDTHRFGFMARPASEAEIARVTKIAAYKMADEKRLIDLGRDVQDDDDPDGNLQQQLTGTEA